MRASVLLALFAVLSIGWAAAEDSYSLPESPAEVSAPDVIVENFRAMDRLYRTEIVRAGGQPSTLLRAPQPLPDTYVYKGNAHSVAEFIDQTDTTGLLVIKGGVIVHESYYLGETETDLHISWSVAKSFVSALVGIALNEGLIESINDPVTNYLPQLVDSGYDEVPIKHILQMSSGVDFTEDYADFESDVMRMAMAVAGGSLDAEVAKIKPGIEPGTRNRYVSADTHVLGMLLTAVSGKSVAAYMEEKLWHPLGMEADAKWILDGVGSTMAMGGLNATLRDFGRFGLLYLNKGQWDGNQIVPAEWIRASVTPDAPHLLPGDNSLSDSRFGYGYQWWIPENPRGDFIAIGVFNQFIYVDPAHDVVIVKTSAYADYLTDYDSEERTVAAFQSLAEQLK